MGFIVLCSFTSVKPSRQLFDFFFTANRDPKGWISISPQIIKEKNLVPLKEYQSGEAATLMFSGGSKDSNDWKARYVFIRPWGSGFDPEVWNVFNE